MSAEPQEAPPAKVRPRRLMLMAAVIPIVNTALLAMLAIALARGIWAPESNAWTVTLIGLGVVIVFGVFAVLVTFMPRWIVERRVRMLSGTLKPAERVEAENDVRLALLQAISGILLALGFLVTWLQLGQAQQQFNTNADATKQQLKQNGAQLSIARTGQLADRFSRAMEQLGTASLDVRVGGIYALEGLLVDLGDTSSGDATLAAYQTSYRRAVIEILTAYVRNHARSDPSAAVTLVTTGDLGVRAADIQAVMSILGRHAHDVPETVIYLAHTNLSGLLLTCQGPGDGNCANLDRGCQVVGCGADFTACVLDAADFYGASLGYAVFDSSRLFSARLAHASLAYASFRGADLTNVDLARADLTGAQLQGAKMTGAKKLDQANLNLAQLQGAQLGGVDLSTVLNLDRADLHDAHANKDTLWPPGYDPRTHGVVFD